MAKKRIKRFTVAVFDHHDNMIEQRYMRFTKDNIQKIADGHNATILKFNPLQGSALLKVADGPFMDVLISHAV